jgi:hypothetical protein
VSIHHIHVDAVGPGLFSLGHLLTEPGKVRSQNGRSQLHYTFGYF